MNKTTSRTIIIVTALLLFTSIAYAISSTDTGFQAQFFNISLSGVTVGSIVDGYSCDASYCIYHPWYNSTQIYAKNASTGVIEYSGTNTEDVLQSAINNGNRIYIRSGEYTGSGNQINLINNSELIGEKGTIFNNISLNLNLKENIIIDGINFIGNPLNDIIHITNSNDILIKNVISNNIGTNSIAVYGFSVSYNLTSSNITFYNVKTYNPGRFGFYFEGTEGLYKDITLEKVTVIGAGKDTRNNTWTTGIDLSESSNISGFKIIDSESSYSWDSGFHIEPHATVLENIQFIRTKSEYNGQNSSNLFGNGYLLSGNNITLLDCTASNNIGGSGTNSGVGINAVGVTNLKIDGCNINNNTGRGIRLLTSNNSIITNNFISDNDNESIMVESDTKDTIISSNRISNNKHNLRFAGTNGLISSNSLNSTPGYGILLSGTYTIIEGNYIDNSIQHSIDVTGSNNILNSNIIKNTGGGYRDIVIEGTGTNNIINHNILDGTISNFNNLVNIFRDNMGISPINFGVNASAPTALGFGDSYSNSSSGELFCKSTAAGDNWQNATGNTTVC